MSASDAAFLLWVFGAYWVAWFIYKIFWTPVESVVKEAVNGLGRAEKIMAAIAAPFAAIAGGCFWFAVFKLWEIAHR